MSNQNKESVLHKIKSLLNHTQKNGATEEEMNSALRLAKRLMDKHLIDESELDETNPRYIIRRDVVIPNKRGYEFITNITSHIAELFDCIGSGLITYARNSRGKRITVHKCFIYGYTEDVEIVEYFINLIVDSAFKDLEKYKKSEYIQDYKVVYGSKGIIRLYRAFMHAYIEQICNNLDEMIKERHEQIEQHDINEAQKFEAKKQEIQKQKAQKQDVVLNETNVHDNQSHEVDLYEDEVHEATLINDNDGVLPNILDNININLFVSLASKVQSKVQTIKEHYDKNITGFTNVTTTSTFRHNDNAESSGRSEANKVNLRGGISTKKNKAKLLN